MEMPSIGPHRTTQLSITELAFPSRTQLFEPSPQVQRIPDLGGTHTTTIYDSSDDDTTEIDESENLPGSHSSSDNKKQPRTPISPSPSDSPLHNFTMNKNRTPGVIPTEQIGNHSLSPVKSTQKFESLQR